MSTTHRKDQSYECGLAIWHPPWMQRFANTKMFMIVYGLLGTIQAMSYMYFIVTLTTIEKRFKIPSQTTGIILSGNEISQIMLSLILSYAGGQRNRPRWIAWGIVFCGLSCYIIALPHFIYGAGDDALHLTQEYLDSMDQGNQTSFVLVKTNMKDSHQLCGSNQSAKECDTLLTIVPLVLIFLSQFVLGIGNTMYYSLGQTYLDDNTKKTNTPLMLAVAMSLRMIGPIFGFFLGYLSLNQFIDTTKTPFIDRKDPRWLGAWWYGWILLGSFMLLFSGLIGMFPKELPKSKERKYNSGVPQVLRHEELKLDEGLPLGRGFSSNVALDKSPASQTDFPKLKDFPKALLRLLRNKLLIFNITSGVFYILGAGGYMTFLTKYMEVQFHKTAQNATIVIGPATIVGMVFGLLVSGLFITKKKPSPSKVLMWNVVVGCIYIVGQISYLFMYCGDTASLMVDGKLNLEASCNANCSCDGVPYTPVCHSDSDTTYFSPCHAGCQDWNSESKFYSNCSCLSQLGNLNDDYSSTAQRSNILAGAPLLDASDIHYRSTDVPYDLALSTIPESLSRSPRSTLEKTLSDILSPGACLKGCDASFWTFSIASMLVNWFGSSGRIGNVLVNYRAVSNEDKSFAQGLTLMMISLFALIPGPILFGFIIDSTCLVWTKQCGQNGNCQLYDQTRFRYLMNSLAVALTCIGVLFDILVWYHGRNLDLYGDKENQRLAEEKKKNAPITPLLTRN